VEFPPRAAGRPRFALTSLKEACIVGADMFWTRKQSPFVTDDVRRLGRMEAQVETLELKWTMYRDEIKKLVNRLEKREERAIKKEKELLEVTVETDNNGDMLAVDEISARVLARRSHNAVHGS